MAATTHLEITVFTPEGTTAVRRDVRFALATWLTNAATEHVLFSDREFAFVAWCAMPGVVRFDHAAARLTKVFAASGVPVGTSGPVVRVEARRAKREDVELRASTCGFTLLVAPSEPDEEEEDPEPKEAPVAAPSPPEEPLAAPQEEEEEAAAVAKVPKVARPSALPARAAAPVPTTVPTTAPPANTPANTPASPPASPPPPPVRPPPPPVRAPRPPARGVGQTQAQMASELGAVLGGAVAAFLASHPDIQLVRGVNPTTGAVQNNFDLDMIDLLAFRPDLAPPGSTRAARRRPSRRRTSPTPTSITGGGGARDERGRRLALHRRQVQHRTTNFPCSKYQPPAN